jgi:hypothetical protein
VVQVVPIDSIALETWHHVVEADGDDLIASLRRDDVIEVTPDGEAPLVATKSGERWSVVPTGVSPNRALSALVAVYMGKSRVNRVIDPAPEAVEWRFPKWSAIVEFPALTIDDVVRAALGSDLLPAGITRFVVPDRALRLNFPIDELRSPGGTGDKQAVLDAAIAERAGQGRIRRYQEPVVILDD